ncbi:MAG: hypothetical protein NTV44_06625, partial [Firmicutes bacterium]|nr:hypothetical protein [Bacillota bacterium]
MNDTETLIFCKTFYQAIAKSPGKTVNWFLDIKDHIDEPRLLKLAVEGGIPEVIFLACYNGKTSDLYRKLTDAFDKDVLELFGNGIASVGSYPKKP